MKSYIIPGVSVNYMNNYTIFVCTYWNLSSRYNNSLAFNLCAAVLIGKDVRCSSIHHLKQSSVHLLINEG